MELKFTKKITNYERIKNMSLDDGGCSGKGPDRCVPAYKAWLESEATDGSEKNKV